MSNPSPGEADFGQALKALLSAAGLTPDRVLAELGDRRGQVSRTSLYDWMKNSHLPEDDGPVMEVICLCLDVAKRRGVPVAPENARQWRQLLAEAKQSRDRRAAAVVQNGERRRGASRTGMPLGRWNPVALGIHPAIGGELPEYAPRAHDKMLHALLDPAVTAGRMVVLRGPSSTGKTRAAYEAVRTCLPDWLVDYPRTPKILGRRLQEGFAPRTVVWLDELRHYISPDTQVLAELGDMLTVSKRVVVIATLWPTHWATYTRERRPIHGGPDYETLRSIRADSLLGLKPLLMGLPELAEGTEVIDPAFGGIIDVPDRFTDSEVLSASQQGNPAVVRAIVAARAAGQPGMVAQYLAGVPDLEAHYSGPGADPYGRAVITAAMDAARFGHASLLPEPLLHQAVVGYLDDSLRTVEQEHWWPRSLQYATRELRGTVRALAPVPPAAGTGVAGYRLADYLEQQGRRSRQTALGPVSLWEALVENTFHRSDLSRAGQSAYDRGLYRYAARLWKKAVLAGGVGVIANLLNLHRRVAPAGAREAAVWVAAHAAVDRPAPAEAVFSVLHAAKYRVAASVLAARAASDVALDDPDALALLLETLQDAEEHAAVQTLIDRLRNSPPGHLRLSSRLVSTLGAVDKWQWQSVAVLAIGPARGDGVADPGSAAASEAAEESDDAGSQPPELPPDRHLAVSGALLDAGAIAEMLRLPHGVNGDRKLTALAELAADRFPLDEPADVTTLFRAFRNSDQAQAIERLLARRPDERVSLVDAGRIAELMRVLREADHPEMAVALGRRFAAQAPMDNPRRLNLVFSDLIDAGEREAAGMLARRAVSRRVLRPLARDVMHTWDGVDLIGEFYQAGEKEAALALAAQVAEEEGPRRPWRLNGVSDLLAIARRLVPFYGADVAQAITASLTHDDYVQGPLHNGWRVAGNLKWLHRADATDAIEALLARRPAEQVSLRDPGGVAQLLGALRRLPGAAAEEARKSLLARSPQDHVRISDAWGLARLSAELENEGDSGAVESLHHRIRTEFEITGVRGLGELLKAKRRMGAVDTAELARRAAEQVPMVDAEAAADLIEALAGLGYRELTAIAAGRAATQAVLDDAREVGKLLAAVRDNGAPQAFATLADRAADAGYYAERVKYDQARDSRFGREPDGTASRPWAWRDV